MRYSSTVAHSPLGTFIRYVTIGSILHLRKCSPHPQYQLALHQIDSMRREGKFVGVDGTVPEGQGIVMAHLNECHELLEMVRCFVFL